MKRGCAIGAVAVSANTAWEVRPTNGSDTSGGGFDFTQGTLGTARTDLVISGSDSTIASSAAQVFVTGDIGKYILVTAGTGFNKGWFWITAVDGSNNATFDRSLGTLSSTGGSFKLYGSIDYSRQNGAQFSVSNLVTNGTPTITSVSAPFTAQMVGNMIYITGGTGSIAANWYMISVFTSSTSVNVDRNTGLSAGTGATGNMGGALQTLAAVAPLIASSNKVYFKAESGLTTTASITFATTGVTPSSSATANRLIGYTTTRGDGGKATITLSTNTGLTGLIFSNKGWWVENITVDCANLGTSTGMSFTGLFQTVLNCQIKNFKTAGIVLSSFSSNSSQIVSCEVTGGNSGATAAISLQGSITTVVNCNIHDNVCTAIAAGGNSSSLLYNLITNNSGGTSDGITTTAGGQPLTIIGNTIYACGRSGIRMASGTANGAWIIKNNLFVNNGAPGIDFVTAAYPAWQLWDGNAFFNNTSGTRNDIDDLTTNVINGLSPYTNTLDVILGADPFTNAAGGDFTLNNNPTGGAAARGHGTPGAIPNVTQTGKIDMGVFQHPDPAINQSRIVQAIGAY